MTLKWATSTDQLYASGNTQPSLDLNFDGKKVLTDQVSGLPLVDHERDASSSNSPGTYVGADGLIKTAPVNLLPYSEKFDQSIWTKANGAQVTPNASASPFGENTADLLTFTGDTQQVYYGFAPSAGTYTLSVYLRVASGSKELRMQTYSPTDGVQNKSITVTNAWQRYSHTVVVSNTQTTFLPCSPVDLGEVYIWGAQLEEGSTATDYIPTNGKISGAPRFDHDPVTGESLGLLIEEERENLLPYSDRFDQWTIGSNSTVTLNAVTAPDGTLTADRVFSPATSLTFVGNGSITSNTTYTASVYAKAVTPGTNDTFSFNVGGGLGNNASSQFTATDEWQRFTFTVTPNNVGSQGSNLLYINNEGDGFASDVYFWGAQLEEGSFSTSYIPTAGAPATRAADIVKITGANFSSFYNQSEGTFFTYTGVRGVDNNTVNSARTFLYNGSSTNGHWIEYRNTSNQISVRTRIGASAYYPSPYLSPVNYLNDKIAFSYSPTGGSAVKGNDITTSSLEFTATVNTLFIGGKGSVSNQLNGHIKRLTYYPYRLPEDTLREITEA